jgi:ubiquinone/menaquinone biosynthesis C-methylase UbiE
MHKRFENAAEWEKHFEGPERDAWQHPDTVVSLLALRPGDRVADIGAGTGYFSVRLARAVPQGKVWAVDIEPDMVRHLGERARRESLANLEPVLGVGEDPRLRGPLDVIFVCDTYHHIANRTAYFARVAPLLAPSGRLVIVDFKQGEQPVGPPPEARVPPAEIDAELAPAGFRRTALDEATLPYQYIATYGVK